jgi:ribosomal protein L11 methylase PrmA
MSAIQEYGSFRDPSGHVYSITDRTFRTVNECAIDDYRSLRDTGFFRQLIDTGWLVESREVDESVLSLPSGSKCRTVLEHSTLPFVSYPYEWSFSALKAAALLHLDLHVKALECGVTLSDASAYNVQFIGTRPIFIDILSFRRYQEGEFWIGHRQFCEQFLNPLLLRAYFGISHNSWYRGGLEGITTADLNRLLPLWRKCLSWNAFTQIYLQSKMQSLAIARPRSALQAVKTRKLPRTAFIGILTQLRNWIAKLLPSETSKTVWGNYATANSYTREEETAKRRFITEFIENTHSRLVWDLGCNTGDYSATALAAGADYVVGFDFDQHALEMAFIRAQADNLKFLPLFLDAANPSPDQGWNELERKGLLARAQADAIIALAFEHHLAIGRNIPLPQVVAWLCGLAPMGVIEFVRKDDPTIQQMLSLREDIFSDYSEEAFATALRRQARLVRKETVSSTGRRLYWYDRS